MFVWNLWHRSVHFLKNTSSSGLQVNHKCNISLLIFFILFFYQRSYIRTDSLFFVNVSFAYVSVFTNDKVFKQTMKASAVKKPGTWGRVPLTALLFVRRCWVGDVYRKLLYTHWPIYRVQLCLLPFSSASKSFFNKKFFLVIVGKKCL